MTSMSIAMVGLRGIPTTYGGVERAVEELSAAMVARGHQVTVYGRRGYSDSSLVQYRGIALRQLPQVNTKHLEAITHTALALGDAIRRREFDVVHIHATGPALLSLLPRLAGLPTIATVQGLDYKREKWGPVATAALRVAARAVTVFPHRTIVVSRELQRHYLESFHADTTYIPNGVRLDPESEAVHVDGLLPDQFVLFLGRLVPEKHVHTLIEAFRLVETDKPLVIAGPSSHSGEYVARLERLALDDRRVRLIGPKYGGEKTWLLANALAFVQPSSIEGLPIALLEALASGRFPIVSNIPENLEPVTVAGGTRLGLSVPVGDAQALAQAIQEALARPDRSEVGRRLQAHTVATYDWRSIAAETERLYLEAING